MKDHKHREETSASFSRTKSSDLRVFRVALASFAGLAFFTAVAAVVLHSEQMTTWDVRALQWLHAGTSPIGIKLFTAISLFGSPVFLGFLLVIVAVLLIRKRQWISLAGWCMALIGGEILETLLKILIQRPRPESAAQFLTHLTYSLPSGHAMTSLIAYTMLAYVLVSVWEPSRAERIVIVVAATLLIMAIGFSRLYLGVHYISDVAAGFAAGTFWVCLCIVTTTFRHNRRNARLERNP